jgi:beta-lactamase class A
MRKSSMNRFTLCALLAAATIPVAATSASGQKSSLEVKIGRIVERAAGKVGLAVIGPSTNDTLTLNGDGRFPMLSVYKFPVALAVLHEVDGGRLSLDQKIHIKKDDLLTGTWSPLREKYPEGNVDVALSELLSYTVSFSDNNGCDILFHLVGGPDSVNLYVHSLGLSEIAIATTEAEMRGNRYAQWRNWSSPRAMARLLQLFDRGKILSEKSREFLWQVMVKTGTGPRRIKGLLPEGTVVAHKTGSSGTSEAGTTAATNDAGIVTLPDGKHLILVAFVSGAAANEEKCEDVIAEIAKAVWDAHSAR